jgi:hypothetical protein
MDGFRSEDTHQHKLPGLSIGNQIGHGFVEIFRDPALFGVSWRHVGVQEMKPFVVVYSDPTISSNLTSPFKSTSLKFPKRT